MFARRLVLMLMIIGVIIGLNMRSLIVPQGGGNPAVSIVDFAFQPAQLTVSVADTVIWTFHGSVTHTTTSDTQLWDSGALSTIGETFSYTFTAPGVYTYHCSFHSSMTGVITVVGPHTTVTPNKATSTPSTTPQLRTSTPTNTPRPSFGTPTITPIITRNKTFIPLIMKHQ